MTNNQGSEMIFDECMENIFQIVFKCVGNEYKPFHIIDAEDRPDKRISFIPFKDTDELNTYHSLNSDEKNQFASKPGIIFVFSTMERAIKSLKDTGIYQVFHNDFMQKLGFSTDEIILLYTILHEIGHWKHFCEIGKRPYEIEKLGEDACEKIAGDFADKHFITCLKEFPISNHKMK